MPNHIQNRLQIVGDKEDIRKVFDFIKSDKPDKEGEIARIDFNKIKPMPEGLEANPHSGIQVWVEICTGQLDFKALFRNTSQTLGEVWNKDEDNKGFDKMINLIKANTAIEHLLGERPNISKFRDDEFDIFIQCLKNLRNTGHMSWYSWSLENWGTKWNAYGQFDKRDTEDTIYFETAWSSPVNLIVELSTKFPNVEFNLCYADEDSGSNTGKITIINGEKTKCINPESQSAEGYEIYFELNPERRGDYTLVEGKYRHFEEEEEVK